MASLAASYCTGGTIRSAESRCLGTVRLLLDAGADEDASDNYGRTALHYAMTANEPDITRLLIERGADVRIKGNRGNTLLHNAAAAGHGDSILHSEIVAKRQ
ncbi:Ankyrin repeat-containing domain protein [Cordyceps fumosorosea ARSEF 2679]|uniref:Ankyrin repeat-containing domain protein n=1 Tax=Cordyceps fumosorosea (strain ARSEF 2679) TaxID=1081104 RepID=A0A166W3D3_CORFA|nr:Ankyrin repeat-containing domain protein [Cordyceps fumosorosea ARSEF 2679]OAA34310.1 Ankyrin repeat-containing domain protein [Cordyceps fumosorosea ARSEF 2679]